MAILTARIQRFFHLFIKLTRPNCLCFKMGQGMTREHIWKIIESIGFSTKQIVGIVDKKANYVDITCQSRQNVLSLYEKLLNVDKISNLRLFESDKITVAIHWVPVPFPIDRLKNYLETKHGSVSKYFAKLDKMGFATGVHYFEMRQDEINDNPIGSYIYIGGEEFLVKYKGQIETCHICNKPGHKGADCNEKFDKQWPKLSESTDNCSKNVETGVVQPPTSAQNQNQKGDRKNVNFASTASNISAVADVNQESESSDLIEHQKATSSSKTYDWFEEVITAENTDRPSDENKEQIFKENRKRRLNDDEPTGDLKSNNGSLKTVKCSNCDTKNPLPELGEKAKCSNKDCDFYIIHCACRKLMFEAFHGVAFIDCTCGLKFQKKKRIGMKAFD